jgi:hypothetical protein
LTKVTKGGAAVLVFQYGSNCLDSEINSVCRLCGDAKFVDIAETVDEYTLAFDVWSKNRCCAASDIAQKPGFKVWGALYEIPDNLIARDTAPIGRKSLDAIEGKKYEHKIIQVRRPNGTIESPLTYVAKNPTSEFKTNIKYVGHIVHGLRERGVNEAYINKVKDIAAANNPTIDTEIRKL